MTYNKCQVYRYDPARDETRQESLNVNRALMRRYFLVQKAKDAGVFGIVVGTLGIVSYMTIIEHVKSLIASAGKRAYLFVMGKLNVAKMANFMEVDVYVLIACPESSLMDSKEFYRPIITPFELELAIRRGREWTGEYVTDFQRLLPGLGGTSVDIPDDDENDEDVDRPHFSLVTGKLKRSHYRAQSMEPSDSEFGDRTLTNLNKNQIARVLDSPAGEYLNSRSFRGLERQIGETPASNIEEGRAGIARGYSTEEGAGAHRQ